MPNWTSPVSGRTRTPTAFEIDDGEVVARLRKLVPAAFGRFVPVSENTLEVAGPALRSGS